MGALQLGAVSGAANGTSPFVTMRRLSDRLTALELPPNFSFLQC